LKEIGDKYKLTEKEVRQIKEKSEIRKIKTGIKKAKVLKAYLGQ